MTLRKWSQSKLFVNTNVKLDRHSEKFILWELLPFREKPTLLWRCFITFHSGWRCKVHVFMCARSVLSFPLCSFSFFLDFKNYTSVIMVDQLILHFLCPKRKELPLIWNRIEFCYCILWFLEFLLITFKGLNFELKTRVICAKNHSSPEKYFIPRQRAKSNQVY